MTFFQLKTLRKWCLKLPFSTNRNNLLYEVFYNYSYLSYVIAHFGKIFFMRPYITKWRRSFVCPSVNQSVYKLALKKIGLQLRNLEQRYTGESFLKRPWDHFFKNRSRFFRMSLKIFSWILVQLLFISQFFASLRGTRGLKLLKFSIEILMRDFEKTLKWFFQRSF